MFCGDLPCSCNAKPAKSKRAVKPKPVQAAPDETKIDLRAAMKSAAEVNTQPQLIDEETAAAIIVLDMFSLLGGDEKLRYEHVLNNRQLRARLWRERRKPA